MPVARKRKLKVVLTYVALAALAVVFYGLRKQILSTFSNFGNLNTFALPLVLVWQTLYYHSQAKLYQSFFGILGKHIDYRFMFRTALELNFVNTVFPSGGFSGFSYFGLKMKNYGVSPGQATLVQMMRFIFIFISFQVLLFTGLLMLAIGGNASDLTILVSGSLATLLVILTASMAYVIGSRSRINAFFTFLTSVINRIIHIVRPAHPETINIAKVRELFTELHENYVVLKTDLKALKKPLIYAMGISLGEILTIYTIYIAYGQIVNPGAVVIAYAIACFAGLLSVLPGGIGVYEGLMTAVLATAGVSPAVSLPVTITYRILNAMIQLPIGYFFYYKTLHAKEIHEQ